MLQGYPIHFNIYAESEQEAIMAQRAICDFISVHARQGRAVTARKVAQAVRQWDKNVFVKSQIIKFLE